MKCFQFCLYLVISTVFFDVACAQSSLVEIKDPNELTVKFEFLGKAGETKKYHINLKDIPNAPPIPTGYKSINKGYYVKTEAIPYDNPMLTFKLPIGTEEEFKRARILALEEFELNPIGSQWIDCTITPEWWDRLAKARAQAGLGDRVKENAEIAKLFPDFSQRTLRCDDGSFKSRGYFGYYAAVVETQAEPTSPFTQLKVGLDNVKTSVKAGETVYTISFKNIGAKDIAELNFLSDFDDDSKVTSIQPSQGKCKRAKRGSISGSTVCHLGKLASGTTATVEFRREPNGMHLANPKQKENQLWRIEGGFKERPEDQYWESTSFTFQPIQP